VIGSVEPVEDDGQACGRPLRPLAGPEGGGGFASWRRRARHADGALVAAVLGGIGLRAWGLGAQSLWYDEWLTAEATTGGLRELVRHVADREGIPPLYFGVMWVWVRVVGDGAVALRVVSLVAGVATVPVAYAVARALRQPRRVARLAAALVAVNPMLIWYSQEARPYSLLALAGASSLLAAVRAADRGHRRDVAVWAVVAALAVAVHYFAGFLVAAEAIGLLLVRRRRWRTWLVALVPTALTLALLAPIALRQYSHEANREWITGFPLADRLADAGRSSLVGPSPPDGRLWLVAFVAVAVAVPLGLARADPGGRRAVAIAAGVGAAAVALALVAAAVGVDAVLGRYQLAALVPLVVAVAAAAGARQSEPVGLLSALVVCATSLVAVVAVIRDPDLQRPDWRAVAEAHAARDTDDDGGRALVVNVYGNLAGPLTAYLQRARVLGPGDAATVTEVDVVVAQPADAPCNFLVGRACSLVFLGAPPPEPLASRLTLDERIELDQFRLDRYRMAAPEALTTADLVAPADRGHALVLVTP
jgi:hypothetical protein